MIRVLYVLEGVNGQPAGLTAVEYDDGVEVEIDPCGNLLVLSEHRHRMLAGYNAQSWRRWYVVDP